MLITTYKVTSPNVIEEFVEDISVNKNQSLVKVDTLAICKADIRYFLGLRNKNVLDHKYPLAPIHEAVGYIAKDYTGDFKTGDKVILVPNYVDKDNCKMYVNGEKIPFSKRYKFSEKGKQEVVLIILLHQLKN